MKPLLDSQATDAAAAAVAVPVLRPGLPSAALRMMSDERLARLVAAGDRSAFEVVFSRYHQELYRYCLSLLRDREDAADALQGTMLRALRALEGETREISLRPWLYRIAHNESIDLLRCRPPRSGGAAELSAALDGVEAGAEARARLQQLLADLRELPERQRGALVMRELSGLDYAQIAEALDTSPAAAKQAVYEARRTLSELADGRELDCEGIRIRLSEGDRRAIRGRAMRAHLRECSSCRDFQADTVARRSALSALPAAGAAEILRGSGAGAAGAALKALAAITAVVVTGAGASQVLPQPGVHRPQAEPRPVPAHTETHRQTHAHANHKLSHVLRVQPRSASGRKRTRHHVAAGNPSPAPRAPRAPTAPAPPPPAPQPSPVAGTPPKTTEQTVAPQVHTQVQQVQGTVDSAVGQVQDALPVKTPALPQLRKR